jgi:Fe-S oxidoreductase
MLGFHRERSLPVFAHETFRTWFSRRRSANASAPAVLLFPDTFNNFFEPAVAIAATEVLERAGLRVVLPARDLCCGRPLYEAGMLDAGRAGLVEILDVLGPLAGSGTPIVGLEPSCLLTLRDELPSMFPRSAEARRLADQALLFDEFLQQRAPQVAMPAREGLALVHGHCHQKALAGMSAELAVLGRAPGLVVDAPDTGCCGMAGAFGYGKDRYELSRTIAERVLLPAVRNSAPDTLIIADGFACRAQIRQFCRDRRPLHLAQALNAMRNAVATAD